MQDLETSLNSTLVRTGSGVAVAEMSSGERSIPANVAQFAEAQRIIVLDAIRTDLLQPDGGRPEHAASMNGLFPVPVIDGCIILLDSLDLYNLVVNPDYALQQRDGA